MSGETSAVFECFGVVEDGTELWYETLADTPFRAIKEIGDRDDDLNKRYANMMAGALRVHRVRIEILESVDPRPPLKKKAETETPTTGERD